MQDRSSSKPSSTARETFDRLTALLPDLQSAFRCDEDMAAHTTYKVGGPADVFFEPSSEEELRRVLAVTYESGLPVTLIGKGSNLVVADAGIRGLVISLGDRFSTVQIYDPSSLRNSEWATILGDEIRGDVYYIYAEAGLSLAELSAIATKNSLQGIAFACGIPGTVGGAVYMNAGAYGASMEDVVIATRFCDLQGKVSCCVGHEHGFGYRHSLFKEQGTVILGSLFMLHRGDVQTIQAEVDDYTERRETTQPLELPSAGSVFKRPPGYFTGKIISDSGLKGYKVGGAAVSTKHAGFIVNEGGATAADIIGLIRYIRGVIKQNYDVDLELEQRFVGEHDPEELRSIGL